MIFRPVKAYKLQLESLFKALYVFGWCQFNCICLSAIADRGSHWNQVTTRYMLQTDRSTQWLIASAGAKLEANAQYQTQSHRGIDWINAGSHLVCCSEHLIHLCLTLCVLLCLFPCPPLDLSNSIAVSMRFFQHPEPRHCVRWFEHLIILMMCLCYVVCKVIDKHVELNLNNSFTTQHSTIDLLPSLSDFRPRIFIHFWCNNRCLPIMLNLNSDFKIICLT